MNHINFTALRNLFFVLVLAFGFSSLNSHLVTADSPTTSLVSVLSNGTQADGDSLTPAISTNGRYIAFASKAANLVPGDTNGFADIFVRDQVDGSVTRVSYDSVTGSQLTFYADDPRISGDGRFVTYLVGGGESFLYDRDADRNGVYDEPGTTETIELQPGNVGGNPIIGGGLNGNWCNVLSYNSISRDGRFVVFDACYSDLVSNTTAVGIFIYSTQTHQTTLLMDGLNPVISPDGRFVAFVSGIDNIPPGAHPDSNQVYVLDRDTDGNSVFDEPGNTVIYLASSNPGGLPGNDNSGFGGPGRIAISDNGQFVTFSSYATDLYSGIDSNTGSDVFLHDLIAHTTTLVSKSISGSTGNSVSYNPSISSDGNRIVFHSSASDLVAQDTNSVPDVFFYDRLANHLTLLSYNQSGAPGNGQSISPAISGDGEWVVFSSTASDLVSGDTNQKPDIFLQQLASSQGFSKISPFDKETWVSTTPLLDWQDSSGATGYEYCINTTGGKPCSNWISTGTVSQIQLTGLSNNVTYYWQARATVGGSPVYANGADSSFWSFTPRTTPPPGAFNKTGPANGAVGVVSNPTLTWEPSSGATSYEYCYDNTYNYSCANWVNIGLNTSVTLNGLSNSTIYEWQVRAIQPGAGVYANAGPVVAYWHFTTGNFPPASFGKLAPSNAAANVGTILTLSWEASSRAERYEYCYDTTNDNNCSNWISTGSNTFVELTGLSINSAYYWQVRAVNSAGTTYADGNNTAFWRFTPGFLSPPDPFLKNAPANGSTIATRYPGLNWQPSSGATSYEYCYDTTDDQTCTNWVNVELNTWAYLSGLSNNTYYWQVRAVNNGGATYANGAATAYASFTVSLAPPGSFGKTSPSNGATGQNSSSTTISWGASSGAEYYEYCYDTSDNDACDGTWNWVNGTNGGATLSISNLFSNTTYYWQVRAGNGDGIIYANGSDSAYWTFTTLPQAPHPFSKGSPSDGAANLPVNVNLYWDSLTYTSDIIFFYCYDTTDDDSCADWQANGGSSSVFLTGLIDNTTYYWQVKAVNPSGTTYANGSPTAFWSFTTQTKPVDFGKTSPVNTLTDVPTNPVLTWGTSSGATSYEYCYDMTNDNNCSFWQYTTSNQVQLNGLNFATTYYWQVRTTSGGGTTYADGDAAAYWQFTTKIAPPSTFSKISPTNGATGIDTSPTLTWQVSAQASAYEYCIDTIDNNFCDGNWISTGTNSYVALSGLSNNTTYSWQVRAVNAGGESYANYWSTPSSWHFTTTTQASPPTPFNKTSPTSGATGLSTSPILSWQASGGANTYEYCYDTTDDYACSSWASTDSTQVQLSGLSNGTTYYWHVLAVNPTGTTHSDGWAIAYWHFTTAAAPPANFTKTSPINGANGVAVNVTLAWQATTGAASYEYCIDTINNNSCDAAWISTGSNTSADLPGLIGNTTYFWQVRAVNTSGTTYAEGNQAAFASFQTGPLFSNIYLPSIIR